MSVHVARIYPGENNVLFTLNHCYRVKKGSSETKEKHSEVWSNNHLNKDKDLVTAMTVRVRFNSYPWITGTYGSRIIFRSPIVVPILEKHVKKNEVFVWLRDSTDRGEHVMNRKFILGFASDLDVKVFVNAYNTYFDHYINREEKPKVIKKMACYEDESGGKNEHENENNHRRKMACCEDESDGKKDGFNDDNEHEHKNNRRTKIARFTSPEDEKGIKKNHQDANGGEDNHSRAAKFDHFKKVFDNGDFRNDLDNQFDCAQDPFTCAEDD